MAKMLRFVKENAMLRKLVKKEDTVVRRKYCVFFWCAFWALAGVQKAFPQAVVVDACTQASRTLIHTASESMPKWDLKAYVSGLLSQNKNFPNLVSESLEHGSKKVIEDQIELMGRLREGPEFQRLLDERGDLLTLKISGAERSGSVTRVVLDEGFVQRWGVSLANAVSRKELLEVEGGNTKASSAFLKEIEDILKSPQGRINEDSLVTALASTIEGVDGNLRREIAEGVAQGDISLLRQHLPETLQGSSFDPTRLGIEMGKDREYYLSFLESSIQSGKRLDELLPTYIFSKHVSQNATLGEYLRDMHEGALDHIKDAHSKNVRIQEVLANLPAEQQRPLKRFLGGRLDRIWREISKHKKVITETADAENTSLTLTEVHSFLGIFRGNLGGDCSTSVSFGYANGPLERVFFITNKRGQDVGFVNGTKVSLPDGRSAFLINTVAGERVSGIMTENILSSLARSKTALGVDEVVIIGEQSLKRNINYSIIRDVYKKSQGEPVKVTFDDRETREIIGHFLGVNSYDSVSALENARYLKIPNIEIAVRIETRPFAPLATGESATTLTGGQKLMLVVYFSDIASALNIAIPSLRGKSFFDLVRNVESMEVAQYKEDMAEISNSLGVGQEEMLDVLTTDYLLGMTRANDAFDSHNVEEVLALMDRLDNSMDDMGFFIALLKNIIKSKVVKVDFQTFNVIIEHLPQKMKDWFPK